MKYDPLVFGKDSTERIVSIEPLDDKAEVFIEHADGSIESKLVDNDYWILAHKKLDRDFKPLDGSLHYAYGKLYKNREKWQIGRNVYKREDVWSIYNPQESLMVRHGYTYFKGMNIRDLSVFSYDLETTGLNPGLPDAKILLISYIFRDVNTVEKGLLAFDEYPTQGEMIKALNEVIQRLNPSVITGYNIFGFDLNYLKVIAEKEKVELLWGRDGSAVKFNNYESKFRKEATQFIHYNSCRAYGREIIDMMFVAIKHDIAARKYPSYAMKVIIKEEGLERADRVFYDASQIRFNYTNLEEWAKIKEYCKDDAEDALALFDLMMPPFFYISQSIPKSFQANMESATGSQLNSLMVRSYLQEGHSIPKADDKEVYEGALSDGFPGIYENVHKVDVASLYPNIILQYDVFDKTKDPKANFLRMVQIFTAQRLEYKKLLKDTGEDRYDALQGAFKILINSAYGFCGAPGLAFNAPKCAEFITAKGREILTQAIDWSKAKGFSLVNLDTDSISYVKSDQTHFSDQERKDLINDLNSHFDSKIQFEDDGNYLMVIVLKPKNYVLWDGKKLKFKGGALKAPLKEPALQEFIKKIIDCIIDKVNNYEELYNYYVAESQNIKDVARWCFKKSITEKVLDPKRTNEQKVLDALDGEEFQEGDKKYFYFKEDGSLGLREQFDGNYDRNRLLKKLYDTSQVFETIIPSEVFLNYSLKRNKKLLEQLLYIPEEFDIIKLDESKS